MPELFKSKLGMLLAGIPLLTILFCMMYFHLIDDMAAIPLLISVLFSSPWYLLLFYILIPSAFGGVGDFETRDFILLGLVSMAIGGLINAVILYLLGFLLGKGFNYLSSRRTRPT